MQAVPDQDPRKIGKYYLPRVVKVRIKGGQIAQGCDVYVGRIVSQGGWGEYNLRESAWANPTANKADPVRLYNIYIRQKIAAEPIRYLGMMYNIVSQGRTLVLGCWCKGDSSGNHKEDVPCHGDIIVQLCRELISALIKNGI